jgi:predicted enzyme related to lactoylglutathione lyase
MTFKLHFMGIAAEDWPAAHRFYTEQFGMAAADRNDLHGNWALIGHGHQACRDTPAILKFELFGFGKTPAGGWEWGRTQGYRPGIFVDDLESEMRTLAAHGIEFPGEIESMRWGRRVEFKAHEGLRWSLEEAPDLLRGNGLHEPNIGCVSLKTPDLAAQKAFYHGLLGMQILHEDEQVITLQRHAGEPYLFLETGGAKIQQGYEAAEGEFMLQGMWVSFSVDDVKASAPQIRAAGLDILQDVTVHEDWQGVDMLIRDPDGNILQIVQYLWV